MNYSNSQRAGVILYLTASLFGGYELSIYGCLQILNFSAFCSPTSINCIATSFMAFKSVFIKPLPIFYIQSSAMTSWIWRTEKAESPPLYRTSLTHRCLQKMSFAGQISLFASSKLITVFQNISCHITFHVNPLMQVLHFYDKISY